LRPPLARGSVEVARFVQDHTSIGGFPLVSLSEVGQHRQLVIGIQFPYGSATVLVVVWAAPSIGNIGNRRGFPVESRTNVPYGKGPSRQSVVEGIQKRK